VIAPALADVVPGAIASVFAIALVGVAAGGVWYLLPQQKRAIGSGTRLLIAAALVALTAWACIALTPAIEPRVLLERGNPSGKFARWMRFRRARRPASVCSAVALFSVGAAIGIAVVPRLLPLRT